MKIAFVFNKKRNESVEQAEFDTPETISAIHDALVSGGHSVIDLEMNIKDSPSAWIRQLCDLKPDLIFNTAEGYYGVGRESLGPTIFEQLQIPYVGPGPYGCFLTLDKFLTKQMVATRGGSVAPGHFVNSLDELHAISREFVYPAFIKPNYEGSSKGITSKSICRDDKELISSGGDLLKQFPAGILVEKFIPGKDISVSYISGMGQGGVLEPLEYVFSKTQYNYSAENGVDIYDYELKNLRDEEVQVRCPAQIEASTRASIMETMTKIIPVLGIVDFGRADFRVTCDGEIFFLEWNALPSLQPNAGVFAATQLLGFGYNETILKIVESAMNRLRLNEKTPKLPGRMRSIKAPKIGLVYNLKRKDYGEQDFEKEAEFDSQSTIDLLHRTIESFGYAVIPIEATKSLSEDLIEYKIDLVFNIAEGKNKRGREAQVPAVCDLLGIEHTGSDVTCLAITLDKALTKKIVAQEGIATPHFRLYQGGKSIEPGLQFPVIVKPNHEGTSKGIVDKCVVNSMEEMQSVALEQWQIFQEPILCEEYIIGREYTVGVLESHTIKVLGPMEIVFSEKAGKFPVYSFVAKHLNPLQNPFFHVSCPVSLGKEMDRKISAFTKKVFRILGCRDLARIDFRIDEKNQIYFIEINPLPGLTPNFSDLVILSEQSGISYETLIKRILTPAIQRWRSMKGINS